MPLHAPASHQITEVDREVAGVEQFDDRGLGLGVVAGQEEWGSVRGAPMTGLSGS
jgi:hypothetical protein